MNFTKLALCTIIFTASAQASHYKDCNALEQTYRCVANQLNNELVNFNNYDESKANSLIERQKYLDAEIKKCHQEKHQVSHCVALTQAYFTYMNIKYPEQALKTLETIAQLGCYSFKNTDEEFDMQHKASNSTNKN